MVHHISIQWASWTLWTSFAFFMINLPPTERCVSPPNSSFDEFLVLEESSKLLTVEQVWPQPPFSITAVFKTVEASGQNLRGDANLAIQSVWEKRWDPIYRQGGRVHRWWASGKVKACIGQTLSCRHHSIQTFHDNERSKETHFEAESEDNFFCCLVKDGVGGNLITLWYASDVNALDFNDEEDMEHVSTKRRTINGRNWKGIILYCSFDQYNEHDPCSDLLVKNHSSARRIEWAIDTIKDSKWWEMLKVLL